MRIFGIGILLLVVAGVGYLVWQSSSGSPDAATVGDGADRDGRRPGEVERSSEAAEAKTREARAKAAGLAAGGRRPERVGKGAVEARVVRVQGQSAVEGATVLLRGTGWGGEAVDLRATTDANGRAALPQVPAGSAYVLRVDAKGEPALERPDVEVRAGRTTNVGTLLLGARVALAGRVVDEKGDGIAGAEVRALVGYDNPMEMFASMFDVFTSIGREPTPLAKTTSAADGSFRLPDLAPGAVAVRATAKGRRQAVKTVRATADVAAEPLTLTLEAGATVAGRVVDESGGGVGGATVAMIAQDDADPLGFLTNRIFTSTDASGRFEAVVSRDAKKLFAFVEAEGYPTTVAPFPAGTGEVRIVLQRGATIEVTLVSESTSEPIPGANVMAAIGDLDGEDSEGGAMPSAVTDLSGVARLTSPAGPLTMLIINAPGHDTVMTGPGGESNAMFGAAGGDVPKDVKAGVVTRFTLRLKTGVVVVGHVRNKAGAPIAGVEVKPLAMFGSSKPVRTDAEGAYRLLAQSNPFGGGGAMLTFRAPGYVPKTDTVSIGDEERRAGEATFDVVLEPGGTLRGRVVDAEGKPVAGARVAVNGSNNFDFSDFMPGGAVAGHTTAADGSYTLVDVSPHGGEVEMPQAPPPLGEEPQPLRGRNRVSVEAEGFVPARSEPVTVKPGADVEVPLVRLSRGAMIKGAAFLPDRRVAAFATIVASAAKSGDQMISIRTQGGTWSSHERTFKADGAGKFEIPAVEEGKVEVVVSAPGASKTKKTIDVPSSSGVVNATVDLRPAARIEGTVRDGASKPVAGATVTIWGALVGRSGDDAYVERLSAVTKADGSFALEGVPVGSVKLATTLKGYRSAKTDASTGTSSEIRIVARTPQETKRLAEIDGEMMKQYRSMDPKDPAAQAATMENVQKLQKEKKELQGDDDGPMVIQDGDAVVEDVRVEDVEIAPPK